MTALAVAPLPALPLDPQTAQLIAALDPAFLALLGCIEPGNVAAGGTACPVRYRCVGCGHFRTDVSYLPNLEAYLADLRRSRERLLGAFDADAWAVAEAMPSEEEIRRVRRLIDRVKADLDDLTDQERAEIHQAVAVVRRSRATMLGMPRVHPGASRPAADGSA